MNQAVTPAVPGAGAVAFASDTQDRLAHWAAQRPEALALLHKQHGEWGAWRWRDVVQAVAQRRAALAGHGLGPGARLAVSGALEPQLIVLALAAHAAGAEVVVIDRHAQGAALRAALQAAAPTLAFVQSRQTLSAWIDSGATHAHTVPVPLIAAQPARHASAAWQVLPLADLLATDAPGPAPVAAPARPRPRLHSLRRALRGQAVLWVDEGTEWAGGLEQVLADWLRGGQPLAAPESSAAAARDRREIQPARLLASAARRQRLAEEHGARLAPPGSLARWLSDRASDAGGGWLSAWLRRRIARLEGLPDQLQPGAVPTVGHPFAETARRVAP
ncbi:MAG: AMP-binding protein [Comamonas sp.]